MPSIASSVEMVPRSRIRELAEIAMTMDGVLRLYFGESNLPTPEYIKQAANRALADGDTFYTENAGLAQRIFQHHDGECHGPPGAAPAGGGPLHRGFRRAGSGRHAAHATLALYFPLQSAGLGGKRRGTAGPARFRAPPRSVAAGG